MRKAVYVNTKNTIICIIRTRARPGVCLEWSGTRGGVADERPAEWSSTPSQSDECDYYEENRIRSDAIFREGVDVIHDGPCRRRIRELMSSPPSREVCGVLLFCIVVCGFVASM